jgi:hypothetical protein
MLAVTLWTLFILSNLTVICLENQTVGFIFGIYSVLFISTLSTILYYKNIGYKELSKLDTKFHDRLDQCADSIQKLGVCTNALNSAKKLERITKDKYKFIQNFLTFYNILMGFLIYLNYDLISHRALVLIALVIDMIFTLALNLV